MIDERLIVLLDSYLDGSLTAEDKQELERMLLDSDAARRTFWERASLHGWTYAAAKLNYSAKPTAEVARERRGLDGVSFEAFFGWLKRAGSFGWKIGLAGGACAAAVMLWSHFHEPVADEDDVTAGMPAESVITNGVATLTHGTGIVWEHETNSIEVGSLLTPGWLQLKSGAVQIDFNSGARVIVEGPAELELISPMEARLRSGKLSARVPEPAHGFKVYTPDVTVTDLGTEFGLDREQSKPVQVEVFEGKVQVAVDGTNQPELLNAGQGVQVSSQHAEPMATINPLDFLSADELARRESVEFHTRYQDWKQMDRLLDKDPATLVHLNFEDRRSRSHSLANRASGILAGTHVTVSGCNWAEGRWPGKGALQFSRPNDRVRLAVPGEFQSLTYVAWVRVDSLTSPWISLALVDTFQTGETHWQIHQNGSLELSVRPVGGKAGWDHLVSRPVMTHELGQWVQLAAVYDGNAGRMSLYLNGKQIASKSEKRRVPLTLGSLELGNWTPRARRAPASYRIRDLHGCMDEFALLSRPLSGEEIRRLYDLGKPHEAVMVAKAPAESPRNP